MLLPQFMDHMIKDSLISFPIAILTFVVIYRIRREPKDGVLFLEILESGKTALFYQLTKKAYVQFVTSIIEKVDSIKFKNSASKIIDIPGHEKNTKHYNGRMQQ